MIRCSCLDQDGNQHEKVFIRDSQPLKFTLHATISDGELQGDLYDAIEEHGGTVLDTDHGTDYVIFIPNEQLSQEGYQKYYNTSRNADKRSVQVREVKLIEDSLMAGVLVDTSRTPRNRGGFPKGKKRNEFTWDDDENLSEFLAITCPNGGRLGHKLYHDLVESYNYGEDRLWVLNHPASAWRERYKKNRKRFDERIDELKVEFGNQDDWDDEEQPPIQDYDIPRPGSGRSHRTEKRKKREEIEIDDSDHDSLFSEGGGGGGVDMHAPEPEDTPHIQNNQQTTQEEEDEVHDALQQVSHYTEQPVASSSRTRLPSEAPLGDDEEAGESISARHRNLDPTQITTKRWPPARRHAATAPAIGMRSRGNANPRMTEDLQGHSHEAGARTPASIHADSESEEEPEHVDHHMVEEEAFDEGDDQLGREGPIASPAPMGEDQDTFEGFSRVEPLLDEFEWTTPPPTSPPQSSQVHRRPLANVQPALSSADQSEETDQASPPPSGLPTVPRRRKGSRPPIDAPARVTRSRSKAADPPPPQRAARGGPLAQKAREEQSTKEEPRRKQRGRPRKIQEEHKVETPEPAVKEDVALMQVDETEEDEEDFEVLSLEDDDEQMLRQLGIIHPDSVRRDKRVASPPHVPAVRTPRSQVTRGSDSPGSSSVETFPMDGTRARAIKRKHEQEERHTPYKPPLGTKAAILAEAQRH